jgi:hypothetical protein
MQHAEPIVKPVQPRLPLHMTTSSHSHSTRSSCSSSGTKWSLQLGRIQNSQGKLLQQPASQHVSAPNIALITHPTLLRYDAIIDLTRRLNSKFGSARETQVLSLQTCILLLHEALAVHT